RAFCEAEILFYRWKPSTFLRQNSFRLKQLDLEDLAEASMQYCDDLETQTYIFRAAGRLQVGEAQGFVLLKPDQTPVHFCWSAKFDGFEAGEVGYVLNSQQPERRLIFDCWTPQSERGKGHYPRAISMLASQLSEAGSVPWIFSASENGSSKHGIVSAGFEL